MNNFKQLKINELALNTLYFSRITNNNYTMSRINFFETSPEQLIELFDKRLQRQFEAFKKDLHNQEAQDDLLTRIQAAELLKIHETTLWHWTNKGRVTAYSIAGKRYYKRSELIGSLKELKK